MVRACVSPKKIGKIFKLCTGFYRISLYELFVCIQIKHVQQQGRRALEIGPGSAPLRSALLCMQVGKYISSYLRSNELESCLVCLLSVYLGAGWSVTPAPK